jgi:protein-L-isoaspartate O-methyltransferase
MHFIDEAKLLDALMNQLKPNGGMVILIGTSSQVWFALSFTNFPIF